MPLRPFAMLLRQTDRGQAENCRTPKEGLGACDNLGRQSVMKEQVCGVCSNFAVFARRIVRVGQIEGDAYFRTTIRSPTKMGIVTINGDQFSVGSISFDRSPNCGFFSENLEN